MTCLSLNREEKEKNIRENGGKKGEEKGKM